MITILLEHGWEVVPEATFNHFGEMGSIDILAWHPSTGALLIVEVKSVVPDMQALLAGVDRKQRIGRILGLELGWRVSTVSRLSHKPRTTPVVGCPWQRKAATSSRPLAACRIGRPPRAGTGAGRGAGPGRRGRATGARGRAAT